MLVYGDYRERVDVGERLQAVRQTLEFVAAMSAGLERHAKLVGVLIEAGQLQQGLEDELGPDAQLGAFVHALAGNLLVSSDSGYASLGQLPQVPKETRARSVEVRLPEGFAFYALYPEAYAAAARRLRLTAPPRVIGIRSIGTTLGAVVAAALGAPVPVSVRPTGDPFARKVELPREVIVDAHYVIVDEGPGLSGSSFGAVADALEEHGVPLDRIAFLPSHDGDLGPEASDAHRGRWRKAQRVAAEFDRSFLERRFGPLQPFSGGGAWQRMKFIGMHDETPVLIKFAGLGAIGERKLEIARALHAAHFTPEPIGLVHGFLVERWCDDAHPLAPADEPNAELGRYIRCRALLFPAPPASGASLAELLAMCRRNIGLALGDDVARFLDRFDIAALEPRVRRVRTDNKMDREEWLRLRNGRLLKTDALDHHEAHDLIGCQGMEWDIAGAIEEFALDDAAIATLVDSIDAADRQLLAFYRAAYGAFRLGQAQMSGDHSAVGKYRRSLEHLLLQNS